MNLLPGEDIWIDRAHRLGKRKPEHETKPRPVIVKFSYFKQKQTIIKNGSKLKDSTINVSEDFSKETLLTHTKLRNYGKDAKVNLIHNTLVIKFYKVTYRRLVLTYTTDKNKSDASKFVKSFSLKDNDRWFSSPQQNNTR